MGYTSTSVQVVKDYKLASDHGGANGMVRGALEMIRPRSIILAIGPGLTSMKEIRMRKHWARFSVESYRTIVRSAGKVIGQTAEVALKL